MLGTSWWNAGCPSNPLKPGAVWAGRLALLGGEVLIEALDVLQSGQARFTPQDESQITVCRKIPKDAGAMDFTQSAEQLHRLVRAMNPWPSAFTFLPDGRRLAVLEARPVPATDTKPGELQSGKSLTVGCQDAALEFVTVKPEGKGAMPGEAFLRGAQLAPGTQFGPQRES